MRRFLPKLAIAGAFAGLAGLLATASVQADTIVPCIYIGASTTWTTAGSPYVVQCPINVASGVTLTIQPGVVVKFQPNSALIVDGNGTLLANGSAGHPITFTSSAITPAAGDWGYILGGPNSHVRLSYCDVGYAGQAVGYNLWTETTDFRVSHCRVHHGLGRGLFLENAGISPRFDDIEISNVAGYGVYQYLLNMTPVYTNIRMTGTGIHALYAGFGVIDRDVTLDGSPTVLNGAPIDLAYAIVMSGTKLTLKPNTRLRMLADGVIEVRAGGNLQAEGQAGAPITFTSVATSPLPGDWRYIYGDAGSTVRLSECAIQYAGSVYGSALWARSSGISVTHCQIANNSGGIHVENDAAPAITYNDIYSNGVGMSNGSLITVSAQLNYWGVCGPTVVSNPNGQGDSLIGKVEYRPYLFQPVRPTGGWPPSQIVSPCIRRLFAPTVTRASSGSR